MFRKGLFLAGVVVFSLPSSMQNASMAWATDTRTITTTQQNNAIRTQNSGCDNGGSNPCNGTAFPVSGSPGITDLINGGSIHFNNCNKGIDPSASPAPLQPCRVTPSMIPPGADTQVGTGLNPITLTDTGGKVVSIGGDTNDAIPSGTSNIMIPGFLIHGTIGETTVNCTSGNTCGDGDSFLQVIQHYQKFISVPNGQLINGVLCNSPNGRCTHIDFWMSEELDGSDAHINGVRTDFTIDAKQDANGNMVPTAQGTPTGTYTVTCLLSSVCNNTSGNFRVVPPVGGFTPGSTDFVIMNDSPVVNPAGCASGLITDPFNTAARICQSGQ